MANTMEDESAAATETRGAPNAGSTFGSPGCSNEGRGDGCARSSGTEVGNRPLDDVLSSIERREILAALRLANGQRTLAARLLQISRSRLYRRMEALGIDPNELGLGGEA